MNNFLSSHIDPNKIFIINRSEIEGRWDPSVYKNIFVFTSKMYPEYKLSEVALINPNTSFRDLDNNSEITFIPMDAIDETNGVVTKTYYRKVSECKGYTKFKEGDLIWAKITPCMQNGNSVIIRNAKQGYGFGSTEFFVIRPKNNNVLIEYIYILLRDQRILNNAMNYFGGSVGQQRVPKEFLINFRLPLPPIEIQQKIINLYSGACVRKQQKEAEASGLLASIESYLLGELGITLPEQDNSLQSRMFTTYFSKVASRLDPLYFKNINQKIEGGIFINYPLKEVAIITKGQSITKDKVVEGDFPVVAGGQTSPYNHNEYNAAGNCITVSASGAYSGYVWYHKNPIFASDCSVIISINEQFVTTIFLYEALKLKQSEIYRLQQGAGQPHVYPNDLAKLNIPLPPLEKQNEIAKHIQSIRTQACSLQKEAQEILEKAKKEVEQIILGE